MLDNESSIDVKPQMDAATSPVNSPSKKRRATAQATSPKQSKASKQIYLTPSSHPPAVLELVTKVLDSCTPAVRNEIAEKFNIDPKLFTMNWHTVQKPKILRQVKATLGASSPKVKSEGSK